MMSEFATENARVLRAPSRCALLASEFVQRRARRHRVPSQYACGEFERMKGVCVERHAVPLGFSFYALNGDWWKAQDNRVDSHQMFPFRSH
jgi:hypothetical protein